MISSFPRRDLLFAPLDKSMALIPGSFCEIVLQPFSDVQITSYLRKFTFFNLLEKAEEAKQQMSQSAGSKSWEVAKQYEEVIDSKGLREPSRNPLNLFLLVNILPDLIRQEKHDYLSQPEQGYIDYARNNKENKARINGIFEGKELNIIRSNQSEKWTRYQLYECFVNQSINQTVEASVAGRIHENEKDNAKADFLFQKISQQLQHIAIRLNYSTASQTSLELHSPELTFCPLLKFDSSGFENQIVFSHRTFQEFCVASSILQEIVEESNENNSYDPKRVFILNQFFLNNDPASIHVFQLLVDAVVNRTIPAATIIKLIKKSSTQQILDSQDLQSKEQSLIPPEIEARRTSLCHHHPYSVAAANAITILNAAGQDFIMVDLNKVCIAGADLRCGIFESTNFASADLQGVNFSGALLDYTDFSKANLKGVRFGVSSEIILDIESSFIIVQSPDGLRMVIVASGELKVFEKQVGSYREIRKLTGHCGYVTSCSFSSDGKLIISGGQDGTVRSHLGCPKRRMHKNTIEATPAMWLAASPVRMLVRSSRSEMMEL